MRITLWSNIESFSLDNKADRVWAISYAEHLRSLGHEVAFGHPLLARPLESDLIHVIGGSRWETLPTLARRTKMLWLSPRGFAHPASFARKPESWVLHLLKMPWRMLRQKRLSVESERAWLRSVNRFIWPGHGRPGGWPRGNHQAFPESPAEAAVMADRWIQEEAKIASPQI